MILFDHADLALLRSQTQGALVHDLAEALFLARDETARLLALNDQLEERVEELEDALERIPEDPSC